MLATSETMLGFFHNTFARVEAFIRAAATSSVAQYLTAATLRTAPALLAPLAAVMVHLALSGLFGAAPSHADFGDTDRSGLEDENLWHLYGGPLSNTRARAGAFFAAFVVDPRVALGFAHLCSGFDELFFGAAEVATKSPFSWWALALFPGTMGARYVASFLDTNPVLSTLLMLNLVLLDVRAWMDVVAAWSFTQYRWATLLQNAIVRSLSSIVLAAAVFIFWSALAFSLLWADTLLVVFLVAGNLAYAFRSTKFIVYSLLRPIDRVLQHAAAAAIKDSSLNHFLGTRWEELYCCHTNEAVIAGGFGEVSFGVAKSTGAPVAIKIIKKPDPGSENALELAMGLAKASLAHDITLSEGALERIKTVALKSFDPHAQQLERDAAINEVRALRAVKALRHPGFIELLTAHEPTDPDFRFVIATARAGTTLSQLIFDKSFSYDERLAALQSTAEALAVLHSAGMAHRDVSLGNIALRLDDPLSTVVLDVGTAFLPEGEDRYEYRLTAKRHMLPPEFHTGLANDAHSLLLMQARDVWAFALSACALLFSIDEEEVATLLYSSPDHSSPDPEVTEFFVRGMDAARAKVNAREAKQVKDAAWEAEWNSPPRVREFALLARGGLSGELAVLLSLKAKVYSWCENTWSVRNAISFVKKLETSMGDGRATLASCSPECNLISQMLHPDPAARLPMSAVATHPLFRDARDKARAAAEAGASASPVTPTAQRAAKARTVPPHIYSPFAPGSDASVRLRGSRLQRLLLLRDVVRATAAAMGGEDCSGACADVGLVKRLHGAVTRVARAPATHVKRAEFSNVLEAAGLTVKHLPFDKSELFLLLDANGDGVLDRKELVVGLVLLLAPRASEEERLELIFNAFDFDGSGALDNNELMQFVPQPLRSRAPLHPRTLTHTLTLVPHPASQAAADSRIAAHGALDAGGSARAGPAHRRPC